MKTHVVNAKDKLGAADRTELAVLALLYGLIDPLDSLLGASLFGDHGRYLARSAWPDSQDP